MERELLVIGNKFTYLNNTNFVLSNTVPVMKLGTTVCLSELAFHLLGFLYHICQLNFMQEMGE